MSTVDMALLEVAVKEVEVIKDRLVERYGELGLLGFDYSQCGNDEEVKRLRADVRDAIARVNRVLGKEMIDLL